MNRTKKQCALLQVKREISQLRVEAVYKQSQIVQTFLSVGMYQRIFHSFPGVMLCGATFEAKCM